MSSPKKGADFSFQIEEKTFPKSNTTKFKTFPKSVEKAKANTVPQNHLASNQFPRDTYFNTKARRQGTCQLNPGSGWFKMAFLTSQKTETEATVTTTTKMQKRIFFAPSFLLSPREKKARNVRGGREGKESEGRRENRMEERRNFREQEYPLPLRPGGFEGTAAAGPPEAWKSQQKLEKFKISN